MNTSRLYVFIFLILGLCFYIPTVSAFKNFQYVDFILFINLKKDLVSLIQAILSATLTLAFSFIGALGLMSLKNSKWRSLIVGIEIGALLPSLLPPLVLVVCFLNIFPLFPFGLTGVVLMHALFEMGFVAVFLSRILQNVLSPYDDLTLLYGASRFLFLKTVWPLIWREFFLIFTFLFIYFLTSLSIPMVMSGGSYTSFELNIYAHIINGKSWNQALHYHFLQILVIFFVIYLSPQKVGRAPSWPSPSRPSPLSCRGALIFLLFPTAVIAMALLSKIPLGIARLQQQPELLTNFSAYFYGSLLIGFLSSGFSFVALAGLGFLYQFTSLRKYFLFWVVPSGAIFGFYFQSQSMHFSATFLIVASLVLSLLSLPVLSKLGLFQGVDQLQEQLEMATFWGTSPGQTYWRIVFPQLLPTISGLSALAGAWAVGDFAISRLLFPQDFTLSMWMQSLVEHYRWDAALMGVAPLMVICFMIFFFYGSVAYVANQKLK